jgi:uncharacterized protein (TIGR00297 family)
MYARVAEGLLASGAVAGLAWWRGSLAPSGAWLALLVGTAVWAGGGAPWFCALMAFFVTSTLLGRVGRARKEATKREFSKGDTRDGWQVLSNGGVAALAAIAMALEPRPMFAAAFVGALATANADTWATELGVLSAGDPISIARLRRVPRGTSGAVSLLGLAATVGGAALIGLVSGLLTGGARAAARITLVATAAGTLGSLADSLLGATAQAAYRCPACARETEGPRHHCCAATTRTRGLAFVGNDVVNAVATLLGAIAAVGLAAILDGQ